MAYRLRSWPTHQRVYWSLSDLAVFATLRCLTRVHLVHSKVEASAALIGGSIDRDPELEGSSAQQPWF